MGRTNHGETIDLPAVEHLSHDHAGFDRFTNANVIRDQQALHLELQCHEKRHKLIGARLDAQLGSTSERTGTAAHGKAQRICEQSGTVLVIDGISARRRECRCSYRRSLERRNQRNDVRFSAGQRAQAHD
ncbi:hypothetical protein EBMC1_14775 [Sphingopyxis sp. MC1]|nr:hypothetical protein EBMC1_14775 [Sphingopyxis sp. MC1]